MKIQSEKNSFTKGLTWEFWQFQIKIDDVLKFHTVHPKSTENDQTYWAIKVALVNTVQHLMNISDHGPRGLGSTLLVMWNAFI